MPTPAKPVDPLVTVPAAVKAAAARAEAAHLASYPAPADPPPAPVVDNPLSPAPPAETTPVTPIGNPPPAVDSFEHKYNSMKGRFEQSQTSIRTMGEQITSLQSVIASMDAAPAPARSAPVATKLITPQEVTDYGEDFLGVVGKKAREETFGDIATLTQKVDDLALQLGKTTTAVSGDARERMFAKLDATLPTWRLTNDDPNFFTWLQLPDAYSGAIRHQLLKTAYGQFDTPRVLAFFNGFLAEEAAVAPAGLLEPDANPLTPGTKIPLETFAAPGRAKTAAGQDPPAEKPIITRQQVAGFYTDIARGKYRGRDEEKNRLEAMIFAATQDGRLR